MCLYLHPKAEGKQQQRKKRKKEREEPQYGGRRVCVCDGGACLWVFVCVSVSVSENRFLFSFTSLFICGTRLSLSLCVCGPASWVGCCRPPDHRRAGMDGWIYKKKKRKEKREEVFNCFSFRLHTNTLMKHISVLPGKT